MIEFLAANTDNGEEGFDRGRFSRIVVDYSNTLDNGLAVSGQISYLLNSRDGTETGFAPDTLFTSVGGGFGTVSLGSHAMALCNLHVRAYSLVPSGWWGGHAGAGFGAKGGGWFAEGHGCKTPTAVSYASPSIGGLTAMVSFAPKHGADQWQNRQGPKAVEDDPGTKAKENKPADDFKMKAENSVEAAVRYAANMGAVDIAVSAGMLTAKDDVLDSTVAGVQFGFGGAIIAADWFETVYADNNGPGDGFSVGAKYTLGNISPAVSYSTIDWETGGESTYLTVGAIYQIGGGLSVWGEYQDIETTGRTGDKAKNNGEDSVAIAGVVIAF